MKRRDFFSSVALGAVSRLPLPSEKDKVKPTPLQDDEGALACVMVKQPDGSMEMKYVPITTCD